MTAPEDGPALADLFRSDAALDRDLQGRIAALVTEARSLWRAPPVTAEHLSAFFSGDHVPDTGLPPDAYVDNFLTCVLDHAVPVSSPRSLANMASVLPGAMPYLAALVTAMNQNLVKTESSRALSLCETQVLRMLHRLVFPGGGPRRLAGGAAGPPGVLTTGGTLANLTAMWSARNFVLDEKDGGPGVRRLGLAAALARRGASGMAIVGSASMHYSFAKAADLLGLGSDGLVQVPVDDRGRVQVPALAKALRRCREQRRLVLGVVGVAGSTDCGAVDPLEEVADLAAAAGAPFHVDAAWGGPALLSERYRGVLRGIERAETVTLDGHKQLYAPVGVGMLLFRETERAQFIRHTADYALRERSADLGRYSIEGSRPGAALLLHAALHLLGRRGYEAAVNSTTARAARLAHEVAGRSELELVLPPELNIVLYRYRPPDLRRTPRDALAEHDRRRLDALNDQIHKQQRAARHALVSRTSWRFGSESHASTVLRAVLASPLTTEADLMAVLDEQVTLGDTIAKRQ